MENGQTRHRRPINMAKAYFTTGETARICAVAPRTVSKWFDAGKLGGYRIPDSRDRRIPRANLIAFLQRNSMLDILAKLQSARACLLCGLPCHLEQRLHELLLTRVDIRLARCLFDAGHAARDHPALAVVDLSLGPRDEVHRVILHMSDVCNRVVVLLPEDAPGVLRVAFEGMSRVKLLQHPCSAEQLIEAIGITEG